MSYADGEKPQVGDILKAIADTGELSIGTKTKVTNVAFGGNLIQVDKSYYYHFPSRFQLISRGGSLYYANYLFPRIRGRRFRRRIGYRKPNSSTPTKGV